MKKHRTEEKPFWETKSLQEMTKAEWESLCDKCGQCCLYKIEDESTGEILLTCVACHELDVENCHCMSYENRHQSVDQCIRIEANDFERFYLLPDSCAYKSLLEGRGLPDWHPLITNDPESVHKADMSIRGKAIPEQNIPPGCIDNYIVGSTVKREVTFHHNHSGRKKPRKSGTG